MQAIVDAHHHLWQLGRFPYAWLAPDSPPRPFGDHSALKQDYLLADYLNDMAGLPLVASVFVEANAGAREAEEVEWVDHVAGAGAIPAVAVGSLDLRHPRADAILERFRRSPRMRGIRMSLCWDRRPQWRFIDRPGVMQTEEFRRGLAALTRHRLVLDVLVVPGQLAELAGVARANPDQPIVINHLGTPFFETEGDKDEWESGMTDCARCPNISVKLSGLWPLDRGWRPERIGEAVRFVVDRFGPERSMWASNYPVEKVMCPVKTQVENLGAVLRDLPPGEVDMIFRATAMRVYRMDVASHALPPASEGPARVMAGERRAAVAEGRRGPGAANG